MAARVVYEGGVQEEAEVEPGAERTCGKATNSVSFAANCKPQQFHKGQRNKDTRILPTHTLAPSGNRMEWNEREWNGMAEQSVSI